MERKNDAMEHKIIVAALSMCTSNSPGQLGSLTHKWRPHFLYLLHWRHPLTIWHPQVVNRTLLPVGQWVDISYVETSESTKSARICCDTLGETVAHTCTGHYLSRCDLVLNGWPLPLRDDSTLNDVRAFDEVFVIDHRSSRPSLKRAECSTRAPVPFIFIYLISITGTSYGATPLKGEVPCAPSK